MNWDAADFAIVLLLLAAAGAIFALAARKSASTAYRSAVGVALAAGFLLVWVNGAVGIIGDESNDANMMYVGVLAIAVAGAVISRLRPAGMARALYATAIAQAAVAAIALTAGLGSTGPAWPRDVLLLTIFFAALWLTSGWLFRRAAGEPPPAPGAAGLPPR